MSDVIYRCGWCGHPCDENGVPKENPHEYLQKHLGATEVKVQGACCPRGNYDPRDYEEE